MAVDVLDELELVVLELVPLVLELDELDDDDDDAAGAAGGFFLQSSSTSLISSVVNGLFMFLSLPLIYFRWHQLPLSLYTHPTHLAPLLSHHSAHASFENLNPSNKSSPVQSTPCLTHAGQLLLLGSKVQVLDKVKVMSCNKRKTMHFVKRMNIFNMYLFFGYLD